MKPLYVQGLDDLTKQLTLLQQLTDGPALSKVAVKAAAIMGREAKRRAPRGPTGNLRNAVNWFRGKKASAHGAIAVVKVRTPKRGAKFAPGTAPHAYLVEYGTPGRRVAKKGGVMRIPLSKLGAMAIGRGKRNGRVKLAGSFGFAFVQSIAAMPAAHSFRDAVMASIGAAQEELRSGVNGLVLSVKK